MGQLQPTIFLKPHLALNDKEDICPTLSVQVSYLAVVCCNIAIPPVYLIKLMNAIRALAAHLSTTKGTSTCSRMSVCMPIV